MSGPRTFAERQAGWVVLLCLLLGCGLAALAAEAEASVAEGIKRRAVS